MADDLSSTMASQTGPNGPEPDIGREFRPRPRQLFSNAGTLTLRPPRGRRGYAEPEKSSDLHVQDKAAELPDLRGAAPPALQRQSGNFDHRGPIQSCGTDAP